MLCWANAREHEKLGQSLDVFIAKGMIHFPPTLGLLMAPAATIISLGVRVLVELSIGLT